MTLTSILTVLLALFACAAHAGDGGGPRIRIAGMPLGSGIPIAGQAPASVDAQHVADGDFHAPNYLPGHPTAAALWPRIVRVACRHDAASGALLCDGYDVSPWRGEYLYVSPFLPKAAPPVPPGDRAPRAPRKKPMG
jgi:hypothetical protein